MLLLQKEKNHNAVAVEAIDSLVTARCIARCRNEIGIFLLRLYVVEGGLVRQIPTKEVLQYIDAKSSSEARAGRAFQTAEASHLTTGITAMNNYLDRINHFRGSPYEIGFAAGCMLGNKLEQTISHYLARQQDSKNMQKLHAGALPWLRSLPKRFQDEFEGMAEGAGLPLQRLAELAYIEECDIKQCSGAVYLFKNQAWVARNNDLYVPELWGYATIREVDGRIPTISFSMQGDIFTPTGINKEKLWLHYNFLPVWDKPSPNKPHIPPYVFLTEALELCRTISDVEALLNQTDRDGGMLLFAVDGKNSEFALFDCMCSRYYHREPSDGWIIGTNHYVACEDMTLGADDEQPGGTLSRYRQMESLMQALSASHTLPDLPADLIRILADDQIERRDEKVVTVYSNVACPSTGEIWYTFGGYPAASKGNWQRLEWPWAA